MGRNGRWPRRAGGRTCAIMAAAPAVLGALTILGGNTTTAWVPQPQSRREVAHVLGIPVATLLGAGAAPSPAAAVQRISAEELAVNALYRRNAPGVLSIADQPLEGSPEKQAQRKVIGSGFAWDRNHVVTTSSMMKGVTRPRVVTLETGTEGQDVHRTLNAALVGVDPVSDVAVLWVDGAMRPLKRGSSEELSVGQDVYALGNPFGLEHSLSKGVVSGVSRTMEGFGGRPISGVIQTDASINPGNNGGPLLDSGGSVIGINNAILSLSGSSSGVGLAIPIEAVERSVTSLITKGSVRWPSLGVTLSSDALSQQLGLPGVMVRKVATDGPAHAAGIRAAHAGLVGDVIVGIDDAPVTSVESFFKALENRLPGEEIELAVLRPGLESKMDRFGVKVTLGSRTF